MENQTTIISQQETRLIVPRLFLSETNIFIHQATDKYKKDK